VLEDELFSNGQQIFVLRGDCSLVVLMVKGVASFGTAVSYVTIGHPTDHR